MECWPNRRLLDLLGLALPLVQAPMAGSDSVALARSVASTGALGSLACALLSPDAVRTAARDLRAGVDPPHRRPINLNFFCHTISAPVEDARQRWRSFLKPHFDALGLDIEAVPAARLRMPFDDAMCAAVEEIAPEVASFHFGLPSAPHVERLKRRGVKILSSATSVREARWLEAHGCDAIIVQGAEAGGHRAMFLETEPASQVGLLALLPQVADAVSVPLIAAGGVADGRGVAAAFVLGASGVQLGTAYLSCPEANVSPLYRQALRGATDTSTVITNLFSGRPARGLLNRYLRVSGPMSDAALAFPHAATLVAPLRKASEAKGSGDYMQMWAGQAAAIARDPMPADVFTRTLAADALRRLRPA